MPRTKSGLGGGGVRLTRERAFSSYVSHATGRGGVMGVRLWITPPPLQCRMFALRTEGCQSCADLQCAGAAALRRGNSGTGGRHSGLGDRRGRQEVYGRRHLPGEQQHRRGLPHTPCPPPPPAWHPVPRSLSPEGTQDSATEPSYHLAGVAAAVGTATAQRREGQEAKPPGRCTHRSSSAQAGLATRAQTPLRSTGPTAPVPLPPPARSHRPTCG